MFFFSAMVVVSLRCSGFSLCSKGKLKTDLPLGMNVNVSNLTVGYVMD